MSRPQPKSPVIHGRLEAFWETGTEGVIWSIYEDGKTGYDGLNTVESGDLLTVFNDASKKQVLWQGEVNLEYEQNYRPYPMNPAYGQQEVLGYWVHGLQDGMPPETWARMFFEEKPATLVKKPARSPSP